MRMERHERGSDLAAYYAELLEEHEESGLSMVEFAEEVGLSSATLYAWRRRLCTPSSRPKLVEVSVAHEDGDVRGPSGAITLRIGERFRLELEPGFDERALERVLSVLSQC